jgi:3-hydroxyacyl-CoA dehydrogenase
MHFFSLVPVMKLVEIIQGLKTTNMLVSVIKELVDKIGNVGVFVKDGPGWRYRTMHNLINLVYLIGGKLELSLTT